MQELLDGDRPSMSSKRPRPTACSGLLALAEGEVTEEGPVTAKRKKTEQTKDNDDGKTKNQSGEEIAHDEA